MDAPSLALGIFTAFNAIVEDIRYCRIAKSIGPDFEASKLKLAITEYRIVRWGKSVGLTEQDVANTAQSDLDMHLLVPEERRKQAQVLLEGVEKRLKEAREKMDRLEHSVKGEKKEKLAFLRKSSVNENRTPLQVGGEVNIMHEERQTEALIKSLDTLRLKHTGPMSFKQKMSWTLFTKAELESLLTELRGMVEDLEKLFPGVDQARAELVAEEAGIFETEHARKLLMGMAAAVQDKELVEAMRRAESSGGDSRTITNNFGTNDGHQTGGDSTISGGTFNFGGPPKSG